MAAMVVLHKPNEFDSQAFAASTRLTLELLESLARLRSPSSELVNRIAAQSFHYTRKITFGTRAAQIGFEVAHKVIYFAGVIKDSITQDRQEFVLGILQMAEQGCRRADEAFCVFGDVRRELSNLIDETREEIRRYSPRSSTRRGSLHNIEKMLYKAIDASERFLAEISAFVRWWDFLVVELASWTPGRRIVLFNVDSLRHAGVVERWHVVGRQFSEYTDKILLLEDTFPLLFLHSPPAADEIGEGEEEGWHHQVRPDLSRILSDEIVFQETSTTKLQLRVHRVASAPPVDQAERRRSRSKSESRPNDGHLSRKPSTSNPHLHRLPSTSTSLSPSPSTSLSPSAPPRPLPRVPPTRVATPCRPSHPRPHVTDALVVRWSLRGLILCFLAWAFGYSYNFFILCGLLWLLGF
ncbi:hypothetical protein B0H34DRAFT_68023 [Crassisporium funariophilum]|nr:hypothetical protein B0H34DRAFT_68023 [Crassisporium funariophilum]